MDNQKELSVFHIRSSQGVINAGYRLYMSNFRKLLQRTWLLAVVYALVIGFMMKLCLQMLPQQIVTVSMYLQGNMSNEVADLLNSSTLLMHVICIVYLLITLLFHSSAMAALSEHQETGTIELPAKWYGQTSWKMMLRISKLALWLLLGGLLAYIVSMGLVIAGAVFAKPSIPLLIGTAVILWMMVAAFFLPLIYTGYKYLLTPGSQFLRTLNETYDIGMRHWGNIFLVGLMVGIITMLFSAIIMLPYYILAAAIGKAQMGVLGGDPIGMPEYMDWMSLVVFIISAFILGYLSLSTLFPFYYLYGSIEKEQQERKAMNIKNEEA